MNKPLHHPIAINAILRPVLSLCCLVLTHSLLCSAAVVVYVNEQGDLFGLARPDVHDAVSALEALATPPAVSATGQRLGSGVLPGTKVVGLETTGDTTTVEFSPDIIGTGLDETRLTWVFEQVRATLRQFGVEGSIRLQAGGKLLCTYLPPVEPVQPRASAKGITPNLTGSALAGRTIGLGPSHGRFYNGSGWYWQRSDPCGFGEAVLEDCNSIRLAQFLVTYLSQDGATPRVFRQLNESDCCHSATGLPWWKMAARYWLEHSGYPASVYNSSDTDLNDDIRARPLAADYDNTDIYIAMHSNAGGGGTANGTETYRDTAMEHPAWETASLTLANALQSSVVSTIRSYYDAAWSNRGVKDSAGGFGEIRIPNRPAVLIELAFHDNCTRDALYLTDNFFRSTCMWAYYKGICDYFGVTPTWAYYSDELVSHDIPTSMLAGSTATVHITFRNRGVLWNDARSFRLGAVGDSDPFTATTRYNVGTEVGPDTSKTFTLTFTAPGTPGTYTTDWRMLREGATWFGATLTASVNVTNATGGPSIVGQPASQTVAPGGTVNLSVVATGSPPLNYQWRKNGADLSDGGNVSGVTTAALRISNVQQTNAGSYTVVVSNTHGSVLSAEAVLTVGIPGIAIGSYTADWQGNPTSCNFPGYDATTCGYPVWYIVDRITTNCNTRGGNATWDPGFVWSGRGWIRMELQVPCSHATSQIYVRYRNQVGAYTGQFSTINECAYGDWMIPLDQVTDELYNWNGCYVNSDESVGAPSGCNATCNIRQTGVAQIHMYGTRWHYINDWTCLGGYASTSVSDSSGRSFAWGETGLYLYPAIDTSHGNVIASSLGLSGKTPGRVTTGDCNKANTLDFKGNAGAFGNGDTMDSYGFAWVFAPSGATPKFAVGSDDGNRLWVNGNLINDTNASRGLTRDQDVTGTASLPVGWSRVLFKVHNFTGTFQGAVSLRNGSNVNWNEPSVNVFDLGGYYSYGVGYEQDAWYPFVYVTNFCGGDSSVPSTDFYTNNTTVTASGSAEGNGPVPFWQVMHYEWGYGLSGDTDYAAVSSGSNSWAHTQTGVTGHRRFHFFAVSKSGRTSFQNNGQTGGANWGGGGAGTYMDVYVDNAPPQSPAFTSAAAVSPSQVDLAWVVPLDQGVGIAPGAAAAADETSNSSGNYYRVGDVGVEVYRDGEIVSGWSASTTASDTGLDANTAYTYTLAARDNSSETRGFWHNLSTSLVPTVAWTLSVPPGSGSVIPDQTTVPIGSNVTWTAVNGFGPGQVQYYRYAWDTSPTHTWTDSETQWSSGTIATAPDSAGTWYLHVKGYNGAAVGNGTFDYSVTTPMVYSQTNAVASMVENGDETFTLSFVGTPQARYYVVTSFDPLGPTTSWEVLPNSTNTAPSPDGVWSITVTNDATQRFYRSAAVNPAP